MIIEQRELRRRLQEFVDTTICPGAALGVLVDGRITTVGAGVANLRSGLRVRPETLFQIGSITKVWTATLVMQLVDDGLVDLDAPVRAYLPDFKLADEKVAAAVTVRHLLTHTSGIEGDVFDDVGPGNDAVERYVAEMASLGSVHELGEAWSYCNSGWVVLARIIEVLREATWDDVVRTRLSQPLGLGPVCQRAGEAILHDAAVGHLLHPKTKRLIVAPEYDIPRALGPAGSVATSVGDLLAFARMHVAGGVAQDATRVLSTESVQAMQKPQAECPEHYLGDAWALGWWVKHWGDQVLVGHGGNTTGQSAYFDMVPDTGVAVALLTNVTGAAQPANDLVRGLLADLAGVDVPPWLTVPDQLPTLNLSDYVGHYQRYAVDYEVSEADGALEVTVTLSGALASEELGENEPMRAILTPVAPDVFLAAIVDDPEGQAPKPVRFLGNESPRRFLHTGARIARRVA